jgi:ribosomal protein S15P/S13E
MPKEKSEEKVPEKKIATKKLSSSEFEKKVLELAKKDLTSEKIGEALKKEKIYSRDYDKKISNILKDNNVYSNPDLQNVQNKLDRISKHFEKNKQDKRALREKSRVFSQLRKLKKYHKVQQIK